MCLFAISFHRLYILDMAINRRQFISSLTCLGLSALLPGGIACAADSGHKRPPQFLLMSFLNTLCIVNATTLQLVRTITLDFIPHSFVPHPLKPEKVWTFQRYYFDPSAPHLVIQKVPYAAKAVEFDVNTGEITQQITLPDTKSQFRGHAFFLPDSDTFFVSRIENKTRRGFLTGYNARDGKRVEDFHVTNGGIHDCQLLKDGTALAACPGNRKTAKGSEAAPLRSSIIHYDIRKGRVLSELVPEHGDPEISHLHVVNDETVIALSGVAGYDVEKKLGSILLGKLGEKKLSAIGINSESQSKFPISEMFSIAVNEQGIAVVANPTENAIFIVDSKGKRFIRRLDIRNPWGVAYNPLSRKFIINGHTFATLDEGLETLKPVEGLPIPPNLPTHGSHSFLL